MAVHMCPETGPKVGGLLGGCSGVSCSLLFAVKANPSEQLRLEDPWIRPCGIYDCLRTKGGTLEWLEVLAGPPHALCPLGLFLASECPLPALLLASWGGTWLCIAGRGMALLGVSGFNPVGLSQACPSLYGTKNFLQSWVKWAKIRMEPNQLLK